MFLFLPLATSRTPLPHLHYRENPAYTANHPYLNSKYAPPHPRHYLFQSRSYDWTRILPASRRERKPPNSHNKGCVKDRPRTRPTPYPKCAPCGPQIRTPLGSRRERMPPISPNECARAKDRPHSPDVAFQMRTVLSSDPETTRLPSGENATEYTIQPFGLPLIRVAPLPLPTSSQVLLFLSLAGTDAPYFYGIVVSGRNTCTIT